MATVLVVDDKDEIRNLLKHVLTLHNHIVLEASDGMEALDAITSSSLPDLIFMDHQMPKLTGVDCAKQLKALYPSLKIVLMSGSFGIDDDGYLTANKYLFTDILLKPFSIEDVVSTVAYALGGEAQKRITFLKLINTIQPR